MNRVVRFIAGWFFGMLAALLTDSGIAAAERNGKIHVVWGFGGSDALLGYDVSRDKRRKRDVPAPPAGQSIDYDGRGERI